MINWEAAKAANEVLAIMIACCIAAAAYIWLLVWLAGIYGPGAIAIGIGATVILGFWLYVYKSEAAYLRRWRNK